MISYFIKESSRRFKQNDSVRYFIQSQKGKGKNIVLTPKFSRGVVLDFDSIRQRYQVKDLTTNKIIDVHPRNLMHDSLRSSTSNSPISSESLIT